MVPVTSLVLPMLVSALIVFVASWAIHMVLPYHKSDLKKLAAEDEVLDTLRRLGIPPGDYAAPLPTSPGAMSEPAFVEKMTRGPAIFLTLSAGSRPSMAGNLIQWLVFCLVVSVFSGYIGSRAAGFGATYLEVFRFVGATAFMGYSLAQAQNSIWFRKNWGTTIKSMFDGLVYGLLTAGTFGWLWPR